MGEAKTYAGGCHCGNVRYRANLDLSKELVTCNCSMCKRSSSPSARSTPPPRPACRSAGANGRKSWSISPHHVT